MKVPDDKKSLEILKVSKVYRELASIIEGVEASIKWLDEDIIKRDAVIEEQGLNENSWEWRDQLDNYARREALIEIINYLSKYK